MSELWALVHALHTVDAISRVECDRNGVSSVRLPQRVGWAHLRTPSAQRAKVGLDRNGPPGVNLAEESDACEQRNAAKYETSGGNDVEGTGGCAAAGQESAEIAAEDRLDEEQVTEIDLEGRQQRLKAGLAEPMPPSQAQHRPEEARKAKTQPDGESTRGVFQHAKRI